MLFVSRKKVTCSFMEIEAYGYDIKTENERRVSGRNKERIRKQIKHS